MPGGIPPTLPPSVEEAYRKKCIQLKRRMNEVEENNDAYRLRKIRLQRGVRKMRLERAFLLETLGERMRKSGGSFNGGRYGEESDGSSENPPTPDEKPLRTKRGHRQRPLQVSPHPSLPPLSTIPSINTIQAQPDKIYAVPIAPNPSTTFTSRAHATNGVTLTTLPQTQQELSELTTITVQRPSTHDDRADRIDQSERQSSPLPGRRPRAPPPPPEAFIESYIDRHLANVEDPPEHVVDALFEEGKKAWDDLPDEGHDEHEAHYERKMEIWRADVDAWKAEEIREGRAIWIDGQDEDGEDDDKEGGDVEMGEASAIHEPEDENDEDAGAARREIELQPAVDMQDEATLGGFTALNK